ncbi:helix-turn-helix domain-containing protein [Mucilaginibacter antarcticus]|uniref:helix-turn-helix domain-containing protein n=1 Tax=Mucilaginibacter antarcticus TaxID=1855725 RepID=UPI00363BA8EA
MDIRTYFPRHPLLRQYISYYYFLVVDDPDFNVTYYSFPNTTTPLNIHKNIETKIEPYATSIAESKEQNNVMLVQGMRKQPLLANLKGRLDKITIHFKPLGLNQFISKPFADIAPLDSQLFTDWCHAPGYNHFIADFYGTCDLERRVGILEAFLLSIYKPMIIDPLLINAVNALADTSNEQNIQQIAQELGISTKTLSRFFTKHLGITAIGFKNIARFRHSLQVNQQGKTLTDIGYESNFCDQAYFINVYKQIAGASPGAFLNR